MQPKNHSPYQKQFDPKQMYLVKRNRELLSRWNKSLVQGDKENVDYKNRSLQLKEYSQGRSSANSRRRAKRKHSQLPLIKS